MESAKEWKKKSYKFGYGRTTRSIDKVHTEFVGSWQGKRGNTFTNSADEEVHCASVSKIT